MPAARGRERGFGLVELMISMLIGLVIIAALVTLFVNTSGNNRELARANSMIENGRFAIKVLEDDLAHAGYWGAYVPVFDDQNSIAVPAPDTERPTAVPNPCLAYSPANWNTAYVTSLIGVPVQAYDDDSAAGLATCVTGALDVIDNHQAGTDVLVVRHVDRTHVCTVVGEVGCDADDAGNLYMQPGLCDSDTTPYVFGTSGYTVDAQDQLHEQWPSGGNSSPTSITSAITP
jgi:type IV pilus assembly protein PilW